VKEIAAVVYETDILGARVVMLVKVIDEQGRLSGVLGDETRERVKKIGGFGKDSAASVDQIVALRNAVRKIVNAMREIVKKIGGLVYIAGVGLRDSLGFSQELNLYAQLGSRLDKARQAWHRP
jgi:anion-transporting  ArsA/GET3 family ATPase